MKFTVKQVFSLTDGRLSTEMGDIYDMLDFLATGSCSGTYMTHHLPTLYQFLKELNPDWFSRAVEQLNQIKKDAGTDDFETLMNYIDKFHGQSYVELVEYTDQQKADMNAYLGENSLLKTIGSKA